MHEIGKVAAIYRYPIKSMRGEQVQTAPLGWHGIEGDRRLAFRRMDKAGGFPWLTATQVAELLLFAAVRADGKSSGELPTHVRTPEGKELPVFSEELAAEVARRYGGPVQMMHLRQGIFDDAFMSVIASDTVREIARLSGQQPDERRFRPNVVVQANASAAFQEEEWLGKTLTFGDQASGAQVSIAVRDQRCSMISLNPDTVTATPDVLKAVARANNTNAGVYGTVTRIGPLSVDQPIFVNS